ncbi:protein IQ-domain 1-like, partial [Trifolium medium]|nr:protein IQ-domain 1-like [Trifolium medium]
GTLAPEKLSALKSNGVENGIQNGNLVLVETIAATRIQTAFRAYK